MKVILTFVLCFVLVNLSWANLTQEQKKKLNEYYEICVSETKVNPQMIKDARAGKFAEDPKLKSYYRCMLNKIGVQNADGTLNLQAILTKLPPGKVTALEGVIKKCSESSASGSPDDTAYKAVKCFVKESNIKIDMD